MSVRVDRLLQYGWLIYGEGGADEVRPIPGDTQELVGQLAVAGKIATFFLCGLQEEHKAAHPRAFDALHAGAERIRCINCTRVRLFQSFHIWKLGSGQEGSKCHDRRVQAGICLSEVVYRAIAQRGYFDSVVVGAPWEPAFQLKRRSQWRDALGNICADLLLRQLRFLLPGVAAEIGTISHRDAVPGGNLLGRERRAA